MLCWFSSLFEGVGRIKMVMTGDSQLWAKCRDMMCRWSEKSKQSKPCVPIGRHIGVTWLTWTIQRCSFKMFGHEWAESWSFDARVSGLQPARLCNILKMKPRNASRQYQSWKDLQFKVASNEHNTTTPGFHLHPFSGYERRLRGKCLLRLTPAIGLSSDCTTLTHRYLERSQSVNFRPEEGTLSSDFVQNDRDLSRMPVYCEGQIDFEDR